MEIALELSRLHSRIVHRVMTSGAGSSNDVHSKHRSTWPNIKLDEEVESSISLNPLRVQPANFIVAIYSLY